MFAIRCPYPYCQHENQPGARFCAACGAPLHLKPCPKCGKVDDVTAKTCAACDTVFPPIKLAAFSDVSPQPAEIAKSSPPASATTREEIHNQSPSQFNRALPLIVIALFAGGVPFLWMNKSLLPSPPKSVAPPALPPQAQPAIMPLPPQPPIGNLAAPPPPSPTAVQPSTPAPAEGAQSVAIQSSTKDSFGAATLPLEKTLLEPAQHGQAKIRKNNAKATTPPASKADDTQPPCTESVAALGLCDRDQRGK